MKRVALIGMPNVGKTALFNTLTGSFQKVANFPGVTVERKTAALLGHAGIEVVDLPGLYSLDIATLDEKVTRDFLTGKLSSQTGDLQILVLDSTNLQKSLYLLLQMLELGHRPLIALGQMDLSQKRGQVLDLEKFSQLSGCQVIPVSAATGDGVGQLVNQLLESAPSTGKIELPAQYQRQIKTAAYVTEKFRTIDDWISQITITPLRPDTLTEQIDRWALHPVWGFVLLAAILVLMFQALFSWSAPLQDGIEFLVASLGEWSSGLIDNPVLKSMLVDGVIGGVGSVLVFLPQILLLFLFVQLLEDVGYLGRAAFLMDGFMRKLGLPGKAMVPLLSSHACAIPGILATRILEDRRERLISMLVLPLTTCSARLPVFTLLIAGLVPGTAVWGPFNAQGLVLFGLYLFAILSAILVAAASRRVLAGDAPSMLLMELPAYRMPKAKHLWRSLLNKASIFLNKAGKVILLLSLVIWVLVSFPRQSDGRLSEVEQSYAATIGRAFEPLFRPLGFDWRINTALIPALGAREVVVSALGTVFAVEGDEDAQVQGLQDVLRERYPPATLGALLMWFVFAPQCISTFAVLRRESGGWLIPGVLLVYAFSLAWLAGFVAHILMS